MNLHDLLSQAQHAIAGLHINEHDVLLFVSGLASGLFLTHSRGGARRVARAARRSRRFLPFLPR